MGASRRRIDRRLSRLPAAVPVLASDRHPLLTPAISLAYAGAIAGALLSVDQLAQYLPGPWFEVLDATVLVFSLLTVILLLRHAWRRHREGLDRRGILWLSGATGAVLLAVVAVYALVQSAEIYSVISGADVHLTRPMIDALPQPPGVRVLDEKPGLADTETISEDVHAGNLATIVPFYERELPKQGWVEDKASATTSIVRFSKDDYLLSVELDPPSSGYTLMIDRQPAVVVSSSASPTP
ncbi:MAG TPA: hypothetical protein VFR68_10285 [Candidatus Dormibacteraeota bacterium]|nr:hypothetical protein [Candidatus Dormibacteraeota bacterium]